MVLFGLLFVFEWNINIKKQKKIYLYIFIYWYFILNNQTTSFVWKTIPKSGIMQWYASLSTHIQGTVFQTVLFVILYIPRLRPGLLSLRSVLASSQIYIQYLTTKQHNFNWFYFTPTLYLRHSLIRPKMQFFLPCHAVILCGQRHHVLPDNGRSMRKSVLH